MADDQIKARIVFDETSLKKSMSLGGTGGGSSNSGGGFGEAVARTGMGLDTQILGEIGAALGGLVLVGKATFDLLSAGFRKITESSPHLQATMDIIAKTLKVTLRPIGDTISMFLRPFAISWLRVVLPIYKAWRQWFGEGGGSEARLEIAGGFKEIADGIWEIDADKIFSGIEQVWSGVKNLFGSFAEEVMGPQFDKMGEWWERLQEKMGTTGIFDTLWESFKSGALAVFEWLLQKFDVLGEEETLSGFGEGFTAILSTAWEGLLGSIAGTSWGDTLIGLGDDLYSIWETFMSNIEGFEWAGPLAPLFGAVKTGWEEIVQPMVDSLVTKLEEKIPGLAGALDFMFGESEDEESGGLIGMIWGAAKGFIGWLNDTFSTAWDEVMVFMIGGMIGLVTYMNTDISTALADVGKDADSMSTSAISSFDNTTKSMNSSVDAAGNLISKLNSIPRNITTTHTIITKRKTED